ncbi:hypothetical protein Syn7803US88_8 [Synechococcus phage S-MbCM6]|uniref:Transglycosylase SLT domain-containing protein n=1 Tax=Synechococcus phage ACG-2014c TaxID=1079998 RepID=A0A0E3FY13_9CAUD|nr:hypothetical protein Syn7803US88_8 [Synechococcus phage ACG-2014c]
MATQVKKSAKINLYKFVTPVKVTGKTEDAALIKVQNSTTGALNNLGKTLNSLGKVLTEFRDNQTKLLKSFEATAPKKFIPKFNQSKVKDPFVKQEEEQGSSNEAPGWLEAIFNLVKDFIQLAVVGPALAWLSDPENRQSIVDALDTIGKIFEVIGGFITDRVKGAIDGLYDFFNEDSSWWEKLTGFFKGFGNFALLMIGIRWITNPVKMVKDVGRVIKTFWNVLKFLGKGLLKRGFGGGAGGASRRRGGRPRGGRRGGLVKGLLTTAAVIGTGVVASNMMSGDDEKAKGGKVKQRARGGFINGPQSGYPVSMDGGKSTSFIGHGLEYVAQKASGGFVVPINTPATKNNPRLMGSRMNEASRMGYNLSGMMKGFDGGGEYNKHGKPSGAAARRSRNEEKHFSKLFMAAGGELAKLGDGTKLVNAPGGYCTTGVLDTAGANNAKIGAPHVATGRDPNNPRGLLAQAVKNYGYAALNIGSKKKITSPYGHVNVKEMNFPQWKKAVKGNKVPSGSLVFSTRHGDWNNSAGSSGNDSAIAKNGGRKLWSGHWQRVTDGVGAVYGAGTRKVVALVHPAGHSGGYDGKGNSGNGGAEMALSGVAKARVGNDKEFLKEVKRVSSKLNINPADLLGLMASESGLNPQARNKSGATGLIQFMPDTARELGTSTRDLYNMNRVEQMKYVEKFLLKTLPKGASLGQMYAAVYLPAFAKKDSDYVLAKKGGFTDSWGNHPAKWYTHNKGLDQNNDGSITIGELGERIRKKKKEFGISGGSTGSFTGDSSDIASTDANGNVIDGIGNVPSNPMEALSNFQSGLLSAFGIDSSSSTSGASSGASQAGGAASSTTGQGQDKLGPNHMRSGGGAGTPGAGAAGDSVSDTKPGSTSGASSVGGTSPPAIPPAASTSGASSTSPVGSTSSNSLVSQTGKNLKVKQQRQQMANQNLAAVSAVAAQQNQRVQALAVATAQPQAQAKAPKPKVISSGGGSRLDLISQLNSTNNPMRSNF